MSDDAITDCDRYEKYGRPALFAIARRILKVPRNQWEMGVWWQTNCKTTGCGLGHSLHLRAVRRLGLRLSKPDLSGWHELLIRGSCEWHWSDLGNRFGISVHAARALFSSYPYDGTQKKVHARIRAFLSQHPRRKRGKVSV